MKLITIIIILFTLNLHAQETRQCYKSYIVKSSDSIYTLFSKFPFKNQYTYKKFLDIVKNENGMTKGSDIVKMTNKLISIPYKCFSKNIKKKKIKNHTAQKLFKAHKKTFDLYGIQATNYNFIKNKSKRDKNKSMIGFSVKSSTSSYKTKSFSTNELTPFILGAEKRFQLHDMKTSILAKFEASNTIFINGLKKNISATNYKLSSKVFHKFSSTSIGLGGAFNNKNFLKTSLKGTDSIQTLNTNLIIKQYFSLNSYEFFVQFKSSKSLMHINPKQTSLSKYSDNEILGSFKIKQYYNLSIFYRIENSIINGNYINSAVTGIGFSTNF